MDPYTVGELADLAGVSVRTLHHYDEIGLLEPMERSEAGYRLYGREQLLRLQQILFYREFDMRLEEIGAILDEPGFSPIHALRSHRRRLASERARISRLLHTIDRTLGKLTEANMRLSDKDLYAGFRPEDADRYRRQAREQFGAEEVERTEERLKQLSKEEWARVQREGIAVAEGLSQLTDRPPEDEEVQDLVRRHHAWIENFYPAPPEVYRGLASMYTEHPEFRAFYDQYGEGTADFLRSAMEAFAKLELE